MKVDVVFLPRDLRPNHLQDRAVAVFDVLRATTTMTAALSVGVSEIRLFPDVGSVRTAAQGLHGDLRPLLMGEERCLAPLGFDLGNSPGALRREPHAGRVGLMSTTNGTRAMIAAKGAVVRYAAALVNASAAARALVAGGHDITLLCAGTGGEIALEDVMGCGAVIAALETSGAAPELGGDSARIARRLFADNRTNIRNLITDGEGGRNVIAAGLPEDIDFCGQIDAFDVVGVVEGSEPIVRRAGIR